MIDLGHEDVYENERNFHLQAKLFMLQNDLLIIISGIEDHIGTISLAQPYKAPVNPNIIPKHELEKSHERISASLSSLTQFHHRDDQLLSEFARLMSQRLNKVVAVVGGIHVPEITKKDIVILSELLKKLGEKIIEKIKLEN